MTFGRVIDVVVLKSMKMRGQAFIVFESSTVSAQAIKALQGFLFLGKPMVGGQFVLFIENRLFKLNE